MIGSMTAWGQSRHLTVGRPLPAPIKPNNFQSRSALGKKSARSDVHRTVIVIKPAIPTKTH